MNKTSYYKKLFFFSGLWNLCSATWWLGLIYIPIPISYLFSMSPPEILFPYNAMFCFIITLGIGYIILSRDISKNHGIVVLGIIAKSLYFINCIITISRKEANLLLLITGIVDIIFVCLFIEFLIFLKMRRGNCV